MAVRLDSDLLRTFVAVAETGNFTRRRSGWAARSRRCRMQIKRLEDMVGDSAVRARLARRGADATGGELIENARRIVSTCSTRRLR